MKNTKKTEKVSPVIRVKGEFYLSLCCHDHVRVLGDVTKYYSCVGCGQPCDTLNTKPTKLQGGPGKSYGHPNGFIHDEFGKENCRWCNTKKTWEELRVGDARDKAKDHFTRGELDFINQLLTKTHEDAYAEGARMQLILDSKTIGETRKEALQEVMECLPKKSLDWRAFSSQEPQYSQGFNACLDQISTSLTNKLKTK